MIQPVAGGGIPPQHAELDMVMEFKEGGAFDFASTFERLKERLRQAVDVARESDTTPGNNVDMNNVHLEDLPAYEDSGRDARVQQPSSILDERRAGTTMAQPEATSARTVSSSQGAGAQGMAFQQPDEPPPGYEEVQRGSVVDELERQARRMSND
jgi:hypothetical protein